MAKPVNFRLLAPDAKSVSIVGDFNHWHPDANPMERQLDGYWNVQIPLHHGHHQYQFVVDGQAVLDPRAQGVERHTRHNQVSLIAVS
jgi:1,4-alpha-glucan branching enzyme